MNQKINSYLMIVFIAIALISTSCQKQEEIDNSPTTGEISIGFNLIDNAFETKQLKTTNEVDPCAAVVTITNEQGEKVINKKRIPIRKDVGSFKTQALQLKQGNYKLTEYYLLNKDSFIIGALASRKPTETKNAEINIVENKSIFIQPEVISTKLKISSEANLKSTVGYSMITMEVDYKEANRRDFSFNLNFTDDAKDINIFWGDGSDSEIATKQNIHKFPADGKYYLMLYGDIKSISNITSNGADASKIVNISFSGADNLEGLTINNHPLTELDVTSLSSLKYLTLTNNNLSELNLDNNIELTGIQITNNNLTNINLNNNQKLIGIELNKNKLTKINISKNHEINHLLANENEISEIIATGVYNKLYWLEVGANKLKELDLSHYPNVGQLSCVYNEITSLDLTKNLNLSTLHCSYNNFTEIDISNCLKLSKFTITQNPNVKSIDISKNVNLRYLRISHTQIKELDLSNNPLLTKIGWDNTMTPEEVNNMYIQLYIHADVNGLYEGELLASDAEPTSPLAIQLKNSLMNKYKWTIERDTYQNF